MLIGNRSLPRYWAKLLFAPALFGCGDMQYLAENYGDIPNEQVSYDGRTWIIGHDAERKRIGVAANAGQSAMNGATYGLTEDPPAVYQMAAQAYLDIKGLPCTAIGATPILSSYEVTYICQ